MIILNVFLMLGVILFAIGFLYKLGAQKEYLLRLSLLVLGIVTSILLGSKLAGIFSISPLSYVIVEFCRLVLPYSQALVIFILGSKLLKETKLTNRETSQHGVEW